MGFSGGEAGNDIELKFVKSLKLNVTNANCFLNLFKWDIKRFQWYF